MATIQELIAASQAANPLAAGRAGTFFAPGGPATGNSIQVGGPPDYNALLAGDPQLQQAQANVRAQQGSAAAARRAATAKILAQLGITPDFSSAMNGLGLDTSYLNQDFGGVEQGLAKTMTEQGLSTTAQLDKQHETAAQNLVDMLAARGTLRGGGLGSGLAVENQRDKQAQFDALQTALNSIGQAQGGYNDVVQQGTRDLATAGDAAVQRQIALHPATGGGSIPAFYDEATGLYKTADGAFFNHDGSATSPGAGNANPVHPNNVAPVTDTPPPVPGSNLAVPTVTPPPTPAQINGPSPTGITVPQQIGQAPGLTTMPLPNFGAGTVTTSYGAVPKATIPAPSATSSPGMPAPNPVPAPSGAGWDAGMPKVAASQAWQNSVAKRLNMPGM